MTEPTYVETGVPGAVVFSEEIDILGDVWIVERNGNGTVVATVPAFEIDETPAERVERLSAELKEAKKALREANK